MKSMSEKMGNFFMKKVEEKSMNIAETSMKKACTGFIYEPKNPLLNTLNKKEK